MFGIFSCLGCIKNSYKCKKLILHWMSAIISFYTKVTDMLYANKNANTDA